MCQRCEPYLIVKRGLYYRPNGEGYTGVRDNAGRYTYAEAKPHEYNPGGDCNPVTIVPLSDAPEFTEQCWPDVARDHLRKQREILAAQVKLMRECHDTAEQALRSAMSKRWNPVPWLREMQAGLDPNVDVRPGMAADEIERMRRALRMARAALEQ